MMRNSARTSALKDSRSTHPSTDRKHLAGLFDEMQALMAVMPGMAFDTSARLSTAEETEAMFDNMPV